VNNLLHFLGQALLLFGMLCFLLDTLDAHGWLRWFDLAGAAIAGALFLERIYT
jgi:hypothetical protein